MLLLFASKQIALAQQITSTLTQLTTDLMRTENRNNFSWRTVQYSRLNVHQSIKNYFDIMVDDGDGGTGGGNNGGGSIGTVPCECPPWIKPGPECDNWKTYCKDDQIAGGSYTPSILNPNYWIFWGILNPGVSIGFGSGTTFNYPPAQLPNFVPPASYGGGSNGGGGSAPPSSTSVPPPTNPINLLDTLEDTSLVAPPSKFTRLVFEKKYDSVILYLLDSFSIPTNNATFKVDTTINAFITDGSIAIDSPQVVKIASSWMKDVTKKNMSFAYFIRAIAHEYYHVIQRSKTPLVKDHNLREFLAYVYTLTNPNFPPLDDYDKKFVKFQISNYYSKLSNQDKTTYFSIYQNALLF